MHGLLQSIGATRGSKLRVHLPKSCNTCMLCFQDAIDWRRLRVLWSPSKGPNAARPPSMSPGPVASSPDSGGMQSQSVRGAVPGHLEGNVATSPSHQACQVKAEDLPCCMSTYHSLHGVVKRFLASLSLLVSALFSCEHLGEHAHRMAVNALMPEACEACYVIICRLNQCQTCLRGTTVAQPRPSILPQLCLVNHT